MSHSTITLPLLGGLHSVASMTYWGIEMSANWSRVPTISIYCGATSFLESVCLHGILPLPPPPKKKENTEPH